MCGIVKKLVVTKMLEIIKIFDRMFLDYDLKRIVWGYPIFICEIERRKPAAR